MRWRHLALAWLPCAPDTAYVEIFDRHMERLHGLQWGYMYTPVTLGARSLQRRVPHLQTTQRIWVHWPGWGHSGTWVGVKHKLMTPLHLCRSRD